jgi:NAD(P)-dependent dehydrogenase (short-subunit alcohol dehydrogenase family)
MHGKHEVVVVTGASSPQRSPIQHFGRIDVWIDNAGITAFAPLERGDFADHRRVIETNLFGAMYGARAARRGRHQRWTGRHPAAARSASPAPAQAASELEPDWNPVLVRPNLAMR